MNDGKSKPELEPPAKGWTLGQAAQALFADKIAAMRLDEFSEAASRHFGLMIRHLSGLPEEIKNQYMYAVQADDPTKAPDAKIAGQMVLHERERRALIQEQGHLQKHFHKVFPVLFAARMEAGDFVAVGVRRDAPLLPPVNLPPHTWGVAVPRFKGLGGRTLAPDPDHETVLLPNGIVLDAVRVHRAHPIIPTATHADLSLSPSEPAIVAASTLQAASKHSAASSPPESNRGQVYSSGALAAWFLLRVKTWPKDKPPPSAPECIAAAQSFFADAPGRDAIDQIRRAKTPPDWRKRGPRPR